MANLLAPHRSPITHDLNLCPATSRRSGVKAMVLRLVAHHVLSIRIPTPGGNYRRLHTDDARRAVETEQDYSECLSPYRLGRNCFRNCNG